MRNKYGELSGKHLGFVFIGTYHSGEDQGMLEPSTTLLRVYFPLLICDSWCIEKLPSQDSQLVPVRKGDVRLPGRLPKEPCSYTAALKTNNALGKFLHWLEHQRMGKRKEQMFFLFKQRQQWLVVCLLGDMTSPQVDSPVITGQNTQRHFLFYH